VIAIKDEIKSQLNYKLHDKSKVFFRFVKQMKKNLGFSNQFSSPDRSRCSFSHLVRYTQIDF